MSWDSVRQYDSIYIESKGYYEELRSSMGSDEPVVHFPMQKVVKMRLRMSSGVVWPVRESSAQRDR